MGNPTLLTCCSFVLWLYRNHPLTCTKSQCTGLYSVVTLGENWLTKLFNFGLLRYGFG